MVYLMITKMFRKTDKDMTYHYLTIRDNNNLDRTRRVAVNSEKQLMFYLTHQKPDTDLFISKYGCDKVVDMVILDFDSVDKKLVEYEVWKLKNYLTKHGLNCFIVDSTNKGYHLYIQIPPIGFNFRDYSERNKNRAFNLFVEELIKMPSFNYVTLDSVNTSAGLGGNIRLPFSIHSKTGRKCNIIDGVFKENPSCYEPSSIGYRYVYDTLNKMKADLTQIIMIEEQEKKSFNNNVNVNGSDFIKDNDLRTLMPEIFGGEVKQYPKGYIYLQCPFHNDTHPSLLVTKYWYSCSGCGSKGNIWTLHKKGYINLFKNKEEV